MSDSENSVSRRGFALRAAAAAAASVPLAMSVETDAEAQEKARDTLRPPHELLADVIRQRFPHDKLSPEIVDLLRADVAGDLGRSIPLEKFPLKNSDEPGFIFAAWRKDG